MRLGGVAHVNVDWGCVIVIRWIRKLCSDCRLFPFFFTSLRSPPHVLKPPRASHERMITGMRRPVPHLRVQGLPRIRASAGSTVRMEPEEKPRCSEREGCKEGSGQASRFDLHKAM